MAGMAAAILADQTVTLRNVPHLPALDRLVSELTGLGVTADWTHFHEISIRSENLEPFPLLTSSQLVSRLPILITAIALRSGVCRMELHASDHSGLMQCMDVMRRFGGLVEIQEGLLRLAFPHKAGIRLSMKCMDVHTCLSAMLLGVAADGETQLSGMPDDPQVSAMQAILVAMGADCSLDGDIWICRERRALGGANITLPSDPMEAGLFGLAALATGGEVLVQGISSVAVTGFLSKLRQMGADYRVGSSELRFWREQDAMLHPVLIEPRPYPGIPGNWVPLLLPLLVQINGESTIQSPTMDWRGPVQLLRSMGAEFFIGDTGIKIFGPVKLAGGAIKVATPGEGLAALIAGLSAAGSTEIEGMEIVEGQFEHLADRFRGVGAKIVRIER
jgi:UDP-N-acetylglucosamine 1-carboxyvinyltransferase